MSPYALVVHPSLPVRDLKEFIAYAKANPGKLSYSSAGVGSASHLAGELLKTMAGIDMVHVPNKGMNPALIDLMGGQVQVLFASVPGMLSERSERLRPIAMAERKRSALLPDLPTIDEQGLKEFEVGNWAGLLAPAGLDPAIVKKLHGEIMSILATADVKDRIKTLGYDEIGSTPEDFAAGYQPESAYFECLHELKLIVDMMYEGGLSWMRYSISDTAEYGDYTRGPRVINTEVRAEMRRILDEIQDGTFAKEWIAEADGGFTTFLRLRDQARTSQLEDVGRGLRQMMPWLESETKVVPT